MTRQLPGRISHVFGVCAYRAWQFCLAHITSVPTSASQSPKLSKHCPTAEASDFTIQLLSFVKRIQHSSLNFRWHPVQYNMSIPSYLVSSAIWRSVRSRMKPSGRLCLCSCHCCEVFFNFLPIIWANFIVLNPKHRTVNVSRFVEFSGIYLIFFQENLISQRSR